MQRAVGSGDAGAAAAAAAAPARPVASEDSNSSVTGAGAPGDGHRAARLLPFRGHKKRRDSSPSKRCVGDHAGIAHHPKVLRMLAKHNEARVLFTDQALKVSREGKLKPRTLLLSDQALYVLKPETFKCGARVALDAIAGVVLSHFADNFCLVRTSARMPPPLLPAHPHTHTRTHAHTHTHPRTPSLPSHRSASG